MEVKIEIPDGWEVEAQYENKNKHPERKQREIVCVIVPIEISQEIDFTYSN